MSKLNTTRPARIIEKTKVKRAEDIQQRADVVLYRRFYRAHIGGHSDLEATPENHARDVVLDLIGEMRLVDDREDVVGACDSIRDKTRVPKNEDVVLRIRNDRGLVLRHLHHGQALESDDRVRHCKSKFEIWAASVGCLEMSWELSWEQTSGGGGNKPEMVMAGRVNHVTPLSCDMMMMMMDDDDIMTMMMAMLMLMMMMICQNLAMGISRSPFQANV